MSPHNNQGLKGKEYMSDFGWLSSLWHLGATTVVKASNQNSRIVNRVTKNNKKRTETKYRDDGADRFAISTDQHDATKLFVDLYGGEVRGGETFTLSGRQARTLYRVLQSHYDFTNKL